ncbi:MAG: CBS domain-containing protein [Nitrospirae bacterium]|nr:CBS domain-containing protein [Nitrospirota bacterium]
MRLREIMKRNVISIPSDFPVIEAARLMAERNIGCLMVVQEGQAKGILTDRDIVVNVIANGADPAATKVEDVMQSHLVSAAPDMDLVEATRLMASHHVRRLPVMEDGHLLGIVTLTDLARVVQEEVDNLCSLRATPVFH